MDIKIIYRLTAVLTGVGLIPIIFGVIILIANIGYPLGDLMGSLIIYAVFGVLVILISYLINKVASYVDQQVTYFQNRVTYLEKQIDTLKKESLNRKN